jgi:hypothetical protein
LNIKDALTGLTDRVSREVIAGVNINFEAGHGVPCMYVYSQKLSAG